MILPGGSEHIIHTDNSGPERLSREERVEQRLARGCINPEDSEGGAAIWDEE